MIINGQRYEAEPAVEAYVKDLQAENEEQRREILRLTDELKEADEVEAFLIVQAEKAFDNALRFKGTIGALKKENAQLEEKYQKATGVIATDSLPTRAELYKIKLMCDKTKECKICAYFNTAIHQCCFGDVAGNWNFGGADND